MLVNRKWLQRGGIGVIAALLVWSVYWFSPDRQVGKAFSQFLEAAGNRNWKKAGQWMAPDYKDQWGCTKEQALHLGAEGFQQFLALQIVASEVKIVRQGAEATVGARLKIVGSGGPIAQMIMDQVNGLQSEFRFAWKRQSWKPWDWKLESIGQPEIDFDPASLP